MGIWPNSTGMVSGWSPTKIVQMVLIGCISRSLGQKKRFSKGIFQKSSLKLQGPELSYLMSSTNIWWTTLVVLCKWLHCDLWPFPQVSDPGPFGPSCLLVSLNRIVILYTQTPDIVFVSGKSPGGLFRRTTFTDCSILKVNVPCVETM